MLRILGSAPRAYLRHLRRVVVAPASPKTKESSRAATVRHCARDTGLHDPRAYTDGTQRQHHAQRICPQHPTAPFSLPQPLSEAAFFEAFSAFFTNPMGVVTGEVDLSALGLKKNFFTAEQRKEIADLFYAKYAKRVYVSV